MTFFSQAYLGQVDPRNPTSKAMNESIELLTDHGITTITILTTLMSIYARVNKLSDRASCNRIEPANPNSHCQPVESRDHNRWGADDLFCRAFGSTLARMVELGQAVDLENLTMADVRTIIALNQRTQSGRVTIGTSLVDSLANSPLSEEEVEILMDPDVRRALDTESARIKTTLEILQQQERNKIN
jgi:hypothetical protein